MNDGVPVVALVGAGPGDPELLTIKAARLIAAADVVLYDRLVSLEILALARVDADLIDVGKRPGGSHTQDVLNELLVLHARSGRRVVRLKGGDPFLFGRGGEEVDVFARHGIACEVVPGISSSLAAPAAAGIPVTHRQIARAVTIVTGHEAHASEQHPSACSKATRQSAARQLQRTAKARTRPSARAPRCARAAR